MEIVFLYCLQIYIHVTILTNCFNFLFLDTYNYVLEVKILFGHAMPVQGYRFCNCKDTFVLDNEIWLFRDSGTTLISIGHDFELILLFFLVYLFTLEISFIFFIFVYKFIVSGFEIFFSKYFVKIVDNPLFIGN